MATKFKIGDKVVCRIPSGDGVKIKNGTITEVIPIMTSGEVALLGYQGVWCNKEKTKVDSTAFYKVSGIRAYGTDNDMKLDV